MESTVQPSFIPKKPIGQPNQRPPHHVSLFSLITSVIFVTVLIIAAIVFGVKYYEQSQLSKKQEILKSQISKFEPALINDLSDLDARLNASKTLLSQHLSVPAVFTAIGNATIRDVRFASFTYSSSYDQSPTISMNGQAKSFAAVALQVKEFQKSENLKYLTNVIISNPNLDANGNVAFSLTATVDPTYLSYALTQKDQGLTVSSSTPIQATTTKATTTSTVKTTTH